MSQPETLSDLMELYACEFLESRGNFTRVTTEPEESAWFCETCESLDVDAHDQICFNCDEEYCHDE